MNLNNLSAAWERANNVDNINKKNLGYYDYESVQWSNNRNYIWSGVYDDHRKQLTYSDRLQLLRVSNFLEINFAQYGELIDLISRFAVGTGIDPTPTTTNGTFNDSALNTWNLWANNRFCDVEKAKTFAQFTRYVAERLVCDGEIFVALVKSKDGYPRLQAIAPVRVRSSGNEKDSSIDGIYCTPYGEPYAYNIYDLEDPGDSKDLGNESYTIVSAENIIHIKDTVGPTQGHGVPWAQAAFNNIRDIKECLKYTLNGVKNGSKMSFQVTDPTGKGGPSTVGGLFGEKYKQTAPGSNDSTVVPGNAIDPNLVNRSMSSPAYRELQRYGELNNILDVGSMEVKPIIDTRPTPNFLTFVQENLRELCQAVGIPYEFTYDPTSLGNKGGDIIIDKTRAFMREVQEILIDMFCSRVYGWVISSMMPLKEIRPLGNENPFEVAWTLPKQVGISRNDIMNNIDARNNKMTNHKIIYGSYGLNWQKEIKQSIIEDKFIADTCKELGVDPAVYGRASISETSTTPSSAPQEEDEPPKQKPNEK